MTKKKAAKHLGIPTYYIDKVRLIAENNDCLTYAVKLGASLKGWARKGEEVLFPVKRDV